MNDIMPFEFRQRSPKGFKICKIVHTCTFEKIEVWSLGLLAYRMAAGHHLVTVIDFGNSQRGFKTQKTKHKRFQNLQDCTYFYL